nr:MAG TPA: hypothetical protein [Caudoviricetes sp.]
MKCLAKDYGSQRLSSQVNKQKEALWNEGFKFMRNKNDGADYIQR